MKTKSGFTLIEESADDLTIYQHGKAILKIHLPEMATKWNCSIPE